MKKPSKIAGGLAALAAAALVLAGCSTDTGSDNGNEAGANLLTIMWKGSEKAGIDAVVAGYKELNPEAEIIVTTADTEQYQATMRTQLSAGSAPDVFYLWPGNGNPAALHQIAPGGFLEDLSGQSWAGDYPDGIRDLMQYDDKTYLMGPLFTAYGAFYNQEALDAAGLTAPAVWDDVLPFCAAAASSGKVAYAMGAATLNNVQNTIYSLVPSLVYGEDPDFDQNLADGETTFSTNEGWITALDYFQQMLDAGCFNADSTGLNNDGMLGLVASGDALGTMPNALQLAALRAAAGPDVTIAYYPLSGGNDAATGIIAATSSGGAAVYSNARNKDMALDFVDYMASTEGTALFVNAMQGPVPAIPNSEIELGPEALTEITAFLEEGRTVPFLNQNWPNARIEQAMFAGLQGMIVGTSTAEDVLASMDAEYNQ